MKMRHNCNKDLPVALSGLLSTRVWGLSACLLIGLLSESGWSQPVDSSVAAPATGELPPTIVPSEVAAPAAPPAPQTRIEPPALEQVPAPELIVDTISPLNQVTAFRTGTPLLDIPQSLSLFSEERIEDQGFARLSDIVEYTPGLINSQGEGHRDSIVFRGIRSTADFYLDGLRDDVEYYRPFYNIEKIEILRGASALYFGRGGTGGIVNRVSKKPIIDDTGASDFRDYEFSMDSFGAYQGQLDINQSLDENSALRLNTFYEYLNNHRDFYDGERFGVNPTYSVNLTPETKLDLSYEFADHEQFIDRGIPSAFGRPAVSLSDVVFADSELNETTFQGNTLRSTLSHEFSDKVKGRLTAFYGDYDKVYQNYFPTAYDPLTDTLTVQGYIDSTLRQNAIFSGDLIVEFDTFDVEHKVFVGGEYTHTSSDQDRFNAVFSPGSGPSNRNGTFGGSNFRLADGSGLNQAAALVTSGFTNLNDDTRVTIDTASVYFQDEIAVTDQLDFVIGGRYDTFDIFVVDAAPGGVNRSRRDEEFSPRYGMVFKPIEDISVYGAYSESFLPRSGEQFSDLGGGRDALDPNTYTNMEAGVNWAVSDGLSLRTAIFENAESSPTVAGPGALVVVDSETTGYEFELTGTVTENWFLSTGYTYLNGEIVNVGGPTGQRPRELPKNSFSVWNKFQLTDRFGLGLGLVYQDDSFAEVNNLVTLPAYTRVDAAAYYQLSEKTRLQVNIENLFDTEYFPYAHTNHNITVGSPINATFSVKSSF